MKQLKELEEYTGTERELMGLFGVDVGNYDIKARHLAFTSSLTLKRVKNGLSTEFIQFAGDDDTWILSPEPFASWNNKTESNDMFILTMFAIAKEAMCRGISISRKESISLSVGMPPGDYNKENVEKYKKYYEDRKNVTFRYGDNEILFDFVIDSITVTAQCWGAAAQYRNLTKDYDEVHFVDIGGTTTDRFTMVEHKIDDTSIVSKDVGVKSLLNKISNEIRDLTGFTIQLNQVNGILRGTRRPFGVVKNYLQVFEDSKYDFVNECFGNIALNNIDLRIMPVVFLGGGAALLEKEIEKAAIENNVCEYKIIKDNKANAIGYETITASGKYHISKKVIDTFWNDFDLKTNGDEMQNK